MKLRWEYDDSVAFDAHKIIDLDTNQDLLKNNRIVSISVKAGANQMTPIVTIELKPDYFEFIDINGTTQKKIKRAKLK
jgi:hypothetical protein